MARAPEHFDLGDHPTNVRNAELATALLRARIGAACRRGYTGTVRVEVGVNDGIIRTVQDADTRNQQLRGDV